MNDATDTCQETTCQAIKDILSENNISNDCIIVQHGENYHYEVLPCIFVLNKQGEWLALKLLKNSIYGDKVQLTTLLGTYTNVKEAVLDNLHFWRK